MEVLTAALFICMYSFYTWLAHGRDAKGRGIIVTSYEPPTDFSPAEVGVLADYKAEDREISATILDLAIRGYIRINRYPEDMSLEQKGYAFTLLRDDVMDLKPHEKTILNGMFGVADASFMQKIQANLTNPIAKQKAMTQYPVNSKKLLGNTITTSELKPYFANYVSRAKSDIYNYLTVIGMFKRNPIQAGADFYILALLSLIALLFVNDEVRILLVPIAGVFLITGVFMTARSRKGQQAKEVVDGFKQFLQMVEKERYRAMQGPESLRTGQGGKALFEKYLPYAIALGIEDSWTSQFKNAYSSDVVISGKLELGLTDVVRFASTVYGFLFFIAKD